MTRAAAAAAAAFGGGVLADRIGGERAVAAAGIVGLACALAYAGLRGAAADQPPAFSARGSIRALRARPLLSRIAVAQGFYGGGLIAAAPLYAIVNVDRLNLSLADVGVIGVLTAVANTIAFPIWGIVADRRGGLTALRLGSMIGATALIGYAIAPGVSVLWLAAIAGGVGGGAIDVGISACVSDETPLTARAAAMAGWNALTGARGIVAAFLMSGLLQLHVVDVTGGLFLCAVTSAIGVGLFIRAARDLSATAAEAEAEARRSAGAAVPGPRPVPSAG
jgi:nitrate/nitrite transporter NarK